MRLILLLQLLVCLICGQITHPYAHLGFPNESELAIGPKTYIWITKHDTKFWAFGYSGGLRHNDKNLLIVYSTGEVSGRWINGRNGS